ncbi:MAG: NBR1-Ig-like domain-containing protein, partial [Anaerolineaceae bacterium]|nr:NBR1-Ig-like domain-containing protein [Anaerolineaceae bacterium]
MKKWLFRLLVGLMALSAGLFGCTSGGMQTIEGKGETAAAYTMAAVLTQAAFQTLEARVTELSRATPTSPDPTDTLAVTPPAALTPAPPSKAAPGATCDLASYVTDVSVPDGTVFEPSQKFTKTWRVKNIGTCAWSTGYTLIHTGGARMDGAQSTPLSKPVAPGEMIDVSV